MKRFDWKTIQRLTIPEGRVRRVSCNGQPIWTSYYSLMHAKLMEYLRPTAKARSSAVASAKSETQMMDTSALARTAGASAAESMTSVTVAPFAVAKSQPGAAAEATQPVELVISATAWSKARSVAVSEIDFMAGLAATSVSCDSAPAASTVDHSLAIVSAANSPAAAPGAGELDPSLYLAAEGASPASSIAAAEGEARVGFDAAVTEAESAASKATFCPAPILAGTLTARPSGAAAGILPMLKITASAGVAESWVYPTVAYKGCISLLPRTSYAKLYKARVGGNGLELR